MHVHLPKPLHGWREFAGEVGIIVLGVLIALGAERLLEDWSWQQRSARAVAALKAELGTDYGDAAEMAIAAPCVDSQLAALEDRVVSSGVTLAPAQRYSESVYHGYTYRAPSREWPDGEWQALIAEGVTSHLDPTLRQSVGLAYGYIAKLRATTHATDTLSYRLQLLALPMPLDASSRNHLVEQLEEARGYFDEMKLRANLALTAIRSSGLAPEQTAVHSFLRRSGTLAFCRAHHISVGRTETQRE